MSRSIMRLALTALAFVSSSPAAVQAQAMDPREVILALESSLVDLDSRVLSSQSDWQGVTSLSYLSRIDENGWAGRLTTHAGDTQLDVLYNGAFALRPDGGYDVQVTARWFENRQGLGGYQGGSAFRLPSATGPTLGALGGEGEGLGSVPVDLGGLPLVISADGTVSVRVAAAIGVPGVVSLVEVGLSGGKDFAERRFKVTGDVRALTILGTSFAEDIVTFELDQRTLTYVSTNEASIFWGLFSSTDVINEGKLRTQDKPYPDASGGSIEDDTLQDLNSDMRSLQGVFDTSPPPDLSGAVGLSTPTYNVMQVRISAVPEPSSGWAAMLGVLIAAGAAWLHKARQSLPAQSSSSLVPHSASAGLMWQRTRLSTFRPRLSYSPCCAS
nr:hypothetical protein [uncultured Aquabacterium sp.]